MVNVDGLPRERSLAPIPISLWKNVAFFTKIQFSLFNVLILYHAVHLGLFFFQRTSLSAFWYAHQFSRLSEKLWKKLYSFVSLLTINKIKERLKAKNFNNKLRKWIRKKKRKKIIFWKKKEEQKTKIRRRKPFKMVYTRANVKRSKFLWSRRGQLKRLCKYTFNRVSLWSLSIFP